MPSQNEIRKSRLLVVEGNHERDLFEAWLEALGREDIQVLPIGGKTLLMDNLRGLVKQAAFPQVMSLLIVRDADDNAEQAFRAACDGLTRAGLVAPRQPEAFIEEPNPADPIGRTVLKTGVFITPGSQRQGALEELLIQTAASDPLAPKASQLVVDAVALLGQPDAQRLPPPSHRRGKAQVHAFLATFEEPDKDPGKAALAGFWDFNHPALQPLLRMLEQL